jgi:integrase
VYNANACVPRVYPREDFFVVTDRPIKLTDAAVKKFRSDPGRRRVIRDLGSESLYLVIQPSGTKSWMMRFRRPDGRSGKVVLGRFDLSGHELRDDPQIGQALSLRAARALASKIHRERRHRDVVADHKASRHRRRAEIAERAAGTFGALARRFVAEHSKVKTRRWRDSARLLGLAYPKNGGEPTETKGGLAQRWADKPVTSIDGHDVWSAVEEARVSGVPGIAARNDGASEARAGALFAAISSMFSWLQRRRLIEVNPVKNVHRPPPLRSRDRVLSNKEIVGFWKAAGKERVEFAAPLKLSILLGQRRSEICGMKRSELSDDLATWSLPAERTKNRRPHVVPLAPLAKDLIASVATTGDLVFTTDGAKPVWLGSKIKKRLDAAMKAQPWRLHDMRRTFVTGMAELGIRPDVIELCINHVSGSRGGIAGVYNKSELLPERKAAMERWANHVTGLVGGGQANVASLRGEA